ncbi:ABC transporter permease [Actinocorallia longicatena]|uniref:ABC transporter permease n=1 Tax=Actinocorallia longicatena TaxID=111803 RepID=A0ABP6Q7M6_9ACTN
MTGFLVRRAAAAIAVLWLVSAAVFTLLHVVAPHPERVIGGPRASAETLAAIRADLGLDEPLFVQYGRFAGGLLRGDLGRSYQSGEPVAGMLADRLPVTVLLVGGGCALALLLGVALGVGGLSRPRLADTVVLGVAATPVFLVGLLLLAALFAGLGAAGLHLVEPGPPMAGHFWRRMALPWLTLGLVLAASYARLTRVTLAETLGADHVRAARSRGVAERRLVWRHGLRVAAVPLATQLGVDMGALLSGAVVVEKVFGVQGAGQLTAQAVAVGDAPVVLGAVLAGACCAVAAATVVDVAVAALDPVSRFWSPSPS